MNITRESLFTLLRTVIMNATGVPECILADPNHSSPSGEYASLEPFQAVNGTGQPTVIQSALNEQTIIENVHVECVVNFYRGDARSRASRLRHADKRADVLWPLFNAGVKWQRVGPINNLSALQSSRIEQRANVTLFLMFKNITVVNLNTILNAPICIEYADGTTVYNEG